MQLPTPDDCMAIMARVPPSQQPVAMPMPSSSVVSVTSRMAPSASTMLSRGVSPPSGTVQTTEMFRDFISRNTPSDQPSEEEDATLSMNSHSRQPGTARRPNDRL